MTITKRMFELNSSMVSRYGKSYSIFNDTLDLYQFITNLQEFSEDYNPRTIEALERYARSKFESYNY